MAFRKSILVYIPGETRTGAEIEVKLQKAASKRVKVLLSSIKVFSISFSFSVGMRLQPICGLALWLAEFFLKIYVRY